MQINKIVLFDFPQDWQNLLPLSATRAIADFRIGILTIKDKWEKITSLNIEILTSAYLNQKYQYSISNNALFINSTILPSSELWHQIEKLNENEALFKENILIAFKNQAEISNSNDILSNINNYKKVIFSNSVIKISYPWDIFRNNGQQIIADIKTLNLKPNPDALSNTNVILGNNIYVMNDVQCEASTINTKDGAVFLGAHSEVMEGCTIRAPFALCEHSTLKMQTKVYGDTTIGPHCKIGGEISNSVIFSYSNKAHDGFLGNSVIGEWCNLGADTNNSNLKNNYGKIKVWNYNEEQFISSNLQFSGLIMGDHAKAAINTQFNTGTVVGVCANVFDAGFPPKFIPDFSWGKNAIFELETAFEVAQRVMERRNIPLTDSDKYILKTIFEHTKKFRKDKH